MKDPLLLTHAIRKREVPASGPFLFDISSRLQPLSIRDQLFRGNAIIKRALADGIIRSGQEEPILVIGGGAAGLMTAMVAMQNNVPVILLERERLFATQAPSGRLVCATEYDWPASHWQRGTYPDDPSRSPLQFRTGEVPGLLLGWQSQLAMWEKLCPNTLNQQIGRTFLDYEEIPNTDMIRVKVDPPEPELPSFRMIVSCAGFGLERTWIPDVRDLKKLKYRGFAFWEDDPLAEEDVGLSGLRPKIIICGGGDGALQDFLRLTCRKPAGEIYAKLCNESPKLRTLAEEAIFRAEEIAMRRFVWGTLGPLDHPIHQQLQTEHQSVIESVFSDSNLWQSIKSTFGSLIGQLDQRLDIKLAYPCDHFSNCYALNRFLVLLVNKYLTDVCRTDALMPRVKIVDVHGVGHNCLGKSVDANGNFVREIPGDPYYCHGKPHNLEYADADCMNFKSAGTNASEVKTMSNGPFNVVIVRHGIRALDPPPLKHLAAALPMRQIIPYDNPW